MQLLTAPRNPNEKNISVETYYQVALYEKGNVEHVTLLDLLEQCLTEPFFDQLRTQQQLGYSVGCSVRQTYGMLGFCFQVVSSAHTIGHVQAGRCQRFVWYCIISLRYFNSPSLHPHNPPLSLHPFQPPSQHPVSHPFPTAIFQFINTIPQLLLDIIPSEFQNNLNSLISDKQKPPTSLFEASSIFWDEINEGTKDFIYTQRQIKVLLIIPPPVMCRKV